MVPPLASAVWPARKTMVPDVARTAWAKPDGLASDGGLTRLIISGLLSAHGTPTLVSNTL
jgi:hypothetical protein